MACSLSNTNSSLLNSLPTHQYPTASTFVPPLHLRFVIPDRQTNNRKPPSGGVFATNHCGGRDGNLGGRSSSSISSLTLPLEPSTAVGKSLSGVLLNYPQAFYDVVKKELSRLADDRDDAVARMDLSRGSPEADLHRRIVELKERESGVVLEDAMYMIIYQKFSKIGVPLVPRLSKCIYNGRLEILPSKDGELESIHSFEELEMIRQQLNIVIGWKAESSVRDNWAPTQVQRLHLSRVYASSILFGYFLKSASLRHQLERRLREAHQDKSGNWKQLPEHSSYGLQNLVFRKSRIPISTALNEVATVQSKRHKKLICFLEEFDADTLRACATLKSHQAANLVEMHCLALFGDEEPNFTRTDGVITTSLSSLKRLVLEAIAFGCFLWDAEEYIDGVYKLKH